MNSEINKKNDVSVVVCGEAGQGIDTVTSIFASILKNSNLNIFSCKEYMSRIRGGHNSEEVRVSSNKIGAFLDRIDILVAFSKADILHLKKRISNETIIITEETRLDESFCSGCQLISVPFSKKSSEIGSKIFSNAIALGVICGLFKVEFSIIENALIESFSDKAEDIIEKNKTAVKYGYDLAIGIKNINIEMQKDFSTVNDVLMNGAEAVSLGCIAGGCDYIAAYPMSPATGLLTFMAKHQNYFGILVEQADDEIAAINQVLGAWYAGSRAMTSTSGGGFSLMTEAVSLAGMIESPVVIHLAQRPGPATGLPTRTEQGDLQLALYSGHGEFPRIIYAPSSLEEAFYLSHKAFNSADKFQVPVFILTDQYFLDSYSNLPPFDVREVLVENFVPKTSSEYKRYELTEDGVSPRGIPAFGDGLVCVDSDEHTESGYITESSDVRVSMVNKRLGKMDSIRGEVISPELIGGIDYKNLIISWGSTFLIVKEALELSGRTDTSLLHFSQVYPLATDALAYFKLAETVVVIENNATGQFGSLLKLEYDIKIHQQILKYDGSPFSVEELTEKINDLGK